MKHLQLPIDCSCNICINDRGRYEISVRDMSYPSIKGRTLSQYGYGKTIEEACVNLGNGLSILLSEEVP